VGRYVVGIIVGASDTGEGVGDLLFVCVITGDGLDPGLGLATVGREATTFCIGRFVGGFVTTGCGGAVASSAELFSSMPPPHAGASTHCSFAPLQKKSSPTSIY